MKAIGRPAVALALTVALAGPAPARPRLGFEAGSDLSSILFTTDPLDLEPVWKVGYHGTVVARGSLAPRLGWVTGIGYRHRLSGDRMTLELWSSDGIPPDPELLSRWTTTYEWDFDQLVIPVRFEWHPWPRSGARLVVGGEAAYLMRARERIARLESADHGLGSAVRARPQAATANIFERNDQWMDMTDSLERLWGSAAGGIGWDIPSGEHSLAVDLRYVHGVHDVFQSSLMSGAVRSVELSLGYRY